MRYKLISCEVFVREMCSVIARCPNEIDVEFLPKGLHDLGREGMSARIQAALDRVDESLYDAILFGYGLCNNGLTGVTARRIPVVLPRAHDCITLFLGSKERYLQYFQDNPGTYFLTSGWIERGEPTGELKQLSIQHQTGMDSSYEELVEKYGEDNAQFLWDELVNHAKNYGKYAYIRMGVEPDGRYERIARERADRKNWKLEHVEGSLSLFERLLAGQWNDEDFLVVQPGRRIVLRVGEKVVDSEPAS